MDSRSVRRQADAERLRALAAASGGRIRVLEDGRNRPQYIVDLAYVTAGSSGYPLSKQSTSRLTIDVGARYPFQPPVATIVSPIFHPNVFPSGVVCLGAKWLASEGIDLFVQRIARLVTFDPLLVNVHSAANGAALAWYLRARETYPRSFPSDRVEAPATAMEPRAAPGWDAPAERVVVGCPRCFGKLRLPSGKAGTVACPRCGHRFEAAT